MLASLSRLKQPERNSQTTQEDPVYLIDYLCARILPHLLIVPPWSSSFHFLVLLLNSITMLMVFPSVWIVFLKQLHSCYPFPKVNLGKFPSRKSKSGIQDKTVSSSVLDGSSRSQVKVVKVKLELNILWKNVGMKENMERSLIGRKTIGISCFIALCFTALLR